MCGLQYVERTRIYTEKWLNIDDQPLNLEEALSSDVDAELLRDTSASFWPKKPADGEFLEDEGTKIIKCSQ